MFTLEQIKTAHSRMKSGADFPAYIADIKKLGVMEYETYVSNGSTIYYGANNYQVTSGGRYDPLIIADESNAEQFKADLKAHQLAQTTYAEFCNQCAILGIEKWVVRMPPMTCTYYDKAGNEILAEKIPG